MEVAFCLCAIVRFLKGPKDVVKERGVQPPLEGDQPSKDTCGDRNVFRMNILEAASLGKFLLNTIQESLALFLLTLHTGINFEAVEVGTRELEDDELRQRSDLGVYHLTRGWSWQIKLPIVLYTS
jgi:hypothetical protein